MILHNRRRPDCLSYSSRLSVTDLACRHALGLRGVAHITIPVDLQEMEIDEEKTSMRYQPGHTSNVFTRPRTIPHDDALQQAAALLNEAQKVVILCGSGAYGAGEELEGVAEILGAPIVKALLGKAVVPDDSLYTTGGIGLLGTVPSQDALQECDALLWVGSSFPYMEFLPKPGQARTVQIDIDPARIGLRYPTEVPLIGDSKHTLQALLPLLKNKQDRSFLEKAQASMQDWRQRLQERGSRRDKPMKPQVVAHELNKLLDDDAVIACDSGTITSLWARYIHARKDQKHAVSGNLASMACALPYAMAAQLAFPERQCVAIIGDGGFTMSLGELATCVKYNLPVKMIVFKNNTLGQIRWEQMLFLGNPEYGCELEPIDFATVDRGFGITGVAIEDPATCGQQLREALSTPGPVVVEAVVDHNELPMPPLLKPDYAENLMQALAKGESDITEILGSTVQERIRKLGLGIRDWGLGIGDWGRGEF